jgi:hypothetical protein
MANEAQLLPEFPLLDFPKITSHFSFKLFFAIGHGKYEMAWLNCPKCGVNDNLYRTNGALTISYCRGGMPPEVEHEQRDILGQVHGTHKHQVNCAHIAFEHFHGMCKVCDFIFGVRIPGESHD